jgi:hypothetical protein
VAPGVRKEASKRRSGDAWVTRRSSEPPRPWCSSAEETSQGRTRTLVSRKRFRPHGLDCHRKRASRNVRLCAASGGRLSSSGRGRGGGGTGALGVVSPSEHPTSATLTGPPDKPPTLPMDGHNSREETPLCGMAGDPTATSWSSMNPRARTALGPWPTRHRFNARDSNRGPTRAAPRIVG